MRRLIGGGLGEIGELGPRAAHVVVGAVLAGLSVLYALTAVGRPLPEAVLAVALCGGVLLTWLRHVLKGRGWTRAGLVVLAVLAYAAVLSAGVSVGLLGLLGGALVVTGRWWAAGAVVASAPVVAALPGGPVTRVVDASLTAVLTGVLVVGLARLVAAIDERSATRMALALAAVEEERLRVAAELDDSVGKGLESVAEARLDDLDGALDVARESLATARAASVELRSLSLAPEIAAARGLLASAGIEAEVAVGHTEPLGGAGSLLAVVLREAVTDVVRQGRTRRCEITTVERNGLLVLRVRNDGVRTAEQGSAALDGARARLEAAGGRLKAGLEPDGRFLVEASVRMPRERPAAEPTTERRLAVALLATTLAVLCVKGLLQVRPGELPVTLPWLLALAAIQLRWTRPPGRWRGWLLAAQAVMSFLPLVVLREPWGTPLGLLAGSLLVLLPARTAWPLAAAVTAAAGAAAQAVGFDLPLLVNTVVSVPVTGLVVFGLVRLARLADELRDAAAELARAAVVQERLRAARDLHDLLGHTLAALLIKGELARRLADRDPRRAAAEFAGMVAMAERARGDLAAVAGAAPRLELAPELDSARGVLEAAGIDVTLTRDGAPPREAEPVLGVVLREAVTNILRHSAARHVGITVADDGLTVVNDGAPAEVTPPGSGIGNLATRLAAHGGHLHAGPAPGGGFRLTATVTREPAE
ncbi:histidine kinase [Actinomadura sp. NPDC047616]|uniref:sensor histidine kinase n=1 Tax=Actinomadura sp. NPDC047616 TaxID=3155914 RepID=UPI0033F78FD4